jgi:hypothetical protein
MALVADNTSARDLSFFITTNDDTDDIFDGIVTNTQRRT